MNNALKPTIHLLPFHIRRPRPSEITQNGIRYATSALGSTRDVWNLHYSHFGLGAHEFPRVGIKRGFVNFSLTVRVHELRFTFCKRQATKIKLCALTNTAILNFFIIVLFIYLFIPFPIV